MRVVALFGDPWGGELRRRQTRVDPWTSSAPPSFPPLYSISELSKQSAVQVAHKEGSGWGRSVTRILKWGWGGSCFKLLFGVQRPGFAPWVKHSVPELSVPRFSGGGGNCGKGGRKLLRSSGSWYNGWREECPVPLRWWGWRKQGRVRNLCAFFRLSSALSPPPSILLQGKGCGVTYEGSD